MAETSLFDAQGQHYGRHGAHACLVDHGGNISVATIARRGDAQCKVTLTVHTGAAMVYLTLDANAAQALSDALADAVTAADAVNDALLTEREGGAL